MTMKIFAAAAVALAMTGAPALAHHSFAMFDSQKELTLQGTVKAFQWTNPHTWIELNVQDAQGKVVTWSIEGSSPNSLSRRGWNRASFKPGEQVTIKIHPLKSGDTGGQFVSAVFSDGRTLGG